MKHECRATNFDGDRCCLMYDFWDSSISIITFLNQLFFDIVVLDFTYYFVMLCALNHKNLL
jgi:hypothetical protein